MTCNGKVIVLKSAKEINDRMKLVNLKIAMNWGKR